MATLAENKKVRFDYEILETFEAGIELLGTEVKSVRNKQVSLEGSFIGIRGSEAFLIHANIPPYQMRNSAKEYDPLRTRKLLLHKTELQSLIGKEHTKGLTLVPLSMYNKGRVLKLQFGIARKKKKFDKRDSIKKRETDREIRRAMKYE